MVSRMLLHTCVTMLVMTCNLFCECTLTALKGAVRVAVAVLSCASGRARRAAQHLARPRDAPPAAPAARRRRVGSPLRENDDVFF